MYCQKRIYVVLLSIGCLLGTSIINATPRTSTPQNYKKKPLAFVKKPQCPKTSCPDISQVCKLASFTVVEVICHEAFDEAWNKDKPKDFEIIKSEVMNKLWPPICGPITTYEDSEGGMTWGNFFYSGSLKPCKDAVTTIIEEKEKKGKETEKTGSKTEIGVSGCPVCPEPTKDDCGEGPLGK